MKGARLWARMTMQKHFGLFIAATIFVLINAQAARAVYYTAAELAETCLRDDSASIQACANYVAGVVDYHQLMQSLNAAGALKFCLPEEITKQQAAVLVMAYLRSAPQHDAFVAAAAIPLALNKAFPCAAAKKAKAR
jgi:hypothetical protein